MENDNGIQLGGSGIFFSAVMGDRPYCKITVVVPPTATDEEIEHAADRYRKVAAEFHEIVQAVNLGPDYEGPIRIPTGATEEANFSKYAESEEEAENLAEVTPNRKKRRKIWLKL